MGSIVNNIQNMTDSIQSLLAQHNVPGCSIAVYDQSSKFYFTLGHRNRNHPVDEFTSFRIASLTKPVFSYMVLRLCQEGIIDLDTPLIEYYGEKYIDHPFIEQLTTRHVLSHQTGFPNWAHTEPLDFEFPPGTKFQYSGEGFVYLQRTLTKITGMPAQQLMKSYVYDPLDMYSSALAPHYLDGNNMTQPHDENGLYMESKRNLHANIIDYANRMPRYANAAGTMWASIMDYTTFMHHLMFNQQKEVRQIFQLMTTEQVEIPEWNTSWGLGIGLQEVDKQRASWHWGSDDGFKTFTMNYLDAQWGITIFTNGENGFKVYSAILEEVLDDLPEHIKYKRKRKQ